MIELFAQRWPTAELVVRPSRVQGAGAAEELAAAVQLLNHVHACGELPLDAIVLGRGGGSAEDLWAFNEEGVAGRSLSRSCRSCRRSGTKST